MTADSQYSYNQPLYFKRKEKCGDCGKPAVDEWIDHGDEEHEPRYFYLCWEHSEKLQKYLLVWNARGPVNSKEDKDYEPPWIPHNEQGFDPRIT